MLLRMNVAIANNADVRETGPLLQMLPFVHWRHIDNTGGL